MCVAQFAMRAQPICLPRVPRAALCLPRAAELPFVHGFDAGVSVSQRLPGKSPAKRRTPASLLESQVLGVEVKYSRPTCAVQE